MNTATQLGNAQSVPENPLLQPVATGAEPSPGKASSSGEALPFNAELQALLEAQPVPGAAESHMPEPGETASTDLPPAGADTAELQNEQSIEQTEAVLSLLNAQQHQQVRVQPSRGEQLAQEQPEPTSPSAAAGAAISLAGSFAEASTIVAQPVQSRQETAAPVQVPVPTGNTEPLALAATEALVGAAQARVAEAAPTSSVAQPGTATPAVAVAERLVRLEGTLAERGEQMLQALRNSVQFQLNNQQQVAVIRLDPPELGNLEIQVSQESGRLSIQINAAQADTLRLLQQTSDRLRHELLTQQFVQVSVQMGGEGHSGQHSHGNRRGLGEAPVRGNPLNASDPASRHAAPDDVLATV